jgi:hypothetical protein
MLVSEMGPCTTFCVVVAPLVLLCLLVWAIRPAANRRQQARRGQSSLVFLTLLGAAAVFVVTPFCVENDPGTLNQLYVGQTPARYGLCFWSTCAAAALYVGNAIARPRWLILPGEMAASVTALACWQVRSRTAATWPWLSNYYSLFEIVFVALGVALATVIIAGLPRFTTGRGCVFRWGAAAVLVAAAATRVSYLSDTRKCRQLFPVVFIFCAAAALPLAVYSANPNCQWNMTPVDCSEDQTFGCPSCGQGGADCGTYKAQEYSGNEGIYTLTQVGNGAGDYQNQGTSNIEVCFEQYDCTNTVNLKQQCAGWESGCYGNFPGMYCNSCGTAELANAGVGQYTVYDVTACGSS